MHCKSFVYNTFNDFAGYSPRPSFVCSVKRTQGYCQTVRAEQKKGKTVRCIHVYHCFYTEAYSNNNRVEPVYNCHPWDLTNWLLNTGSLKILRGRGLLSIFMAYHTKTLQPRNNWTK